MIMMTNTPEHNFDTAQNRSISSSLWHYDIRKKFHENTSNCSKRNDRLMDVIKQLSSSGM